jgi:hypothetical protein
LARKPVLKIALVCGLTFFGVMQLWISWGKIVNAEPGSYERFSYSRVYLDHKFCGDYLNRHNAPSDYVIAFASATQTAAYFDGTIHAAIKPALTQYEGQEIHYIAGAKFFETKEELILLVRENVNTDENIWVFVNKKYRSAGFWGKDFVEKLSEYTVCAASDQYSSLAKITYQQFFEILDYL